MDQPFYPIPLLNEIHTWFPDILYNPGRFRNVQDLLAYIRQVADVSPYSRGLQQYVSNRPVTLHPMAPGSSATNSAIVSSLFEPRVEPIPSERGYSYTARTNINGNPVTARVRTMPISTTIIEAEEVEEMNEQTISNMLNQLLSGTVIRDFLGQNVVVAPTTQQIEQSSTLENLPSTLEDNCTICQDSMEEGQQVRRLQHCHHVFHKTCIDTWFRSNVHCPTCRHDIRETSTAINVPPPVPENHRRTNIRDTSDL